MNLSEMFQSDVISVDPEATIEHVVHKMKHDNVGAVVVTDDGIVVGIVTDRDIAITLALNEAKRGTPVNEIMTKDVITIWDDQGVFNATQYLLGHKIRRLPIIDRSNHLVGMVKHVIEACPSIFWQATSLLLSS